MANNFIDISKLALFNREGLPMNLEAVTGDDGSEYLSGAVFFNPLSVALYDCQNIYVLSRSESAIRASGHIFSSTDNVYSYFIHGVAAASDARPGMVISELTSTSVPHPHIDPPMPIAWSPVMVASADPVSGKVKMTSRAVLPGAVDFEMVSYAYEYPAGVPGGRYVFNWKKTSADNVVGGYPHLNDEQHSVGDRNIYRNRLYVCVQSYSGGYLGNESMWKRASSNSDDYGFFIYDILTDSSGSPFMEKQIAYSLPYSAGMDGVRYPLELNVAFNPSEEKAYDNILEIWYYVGTDGQKLVELSFYGEGVEEDERFAVWLANFGLKFSREDSAMLHDYNLREAMPDWSLVNSARKDLFFGKQDVLPYIGTYLGLRNIIGLLGYSDLLKVKEYWTNTNPNSPYSGKMLLADVSAMLDTGTISTLNLVDENKDVKLSPHMRKTGFIALSYSFTRQSGEYDEDGMPVIEDTADMTQPEVFYKLYKMKEKLQREFLPTNVVIRDIIGEFVYFYKMSTFSWRDETSIYESEVGENFGITASPSERLYTRDISSLYRRSYVTGMAMPSYCFNASNVNPYDFNQKYDAQNIPGFISAIESYYAALSSHDEATIDNNYYWECGDEPGAKLGCPVVLSLDVSRLRVEDMRNRRTSDFLTGYGQVDQPYFTMTNTDRHIEPGSPAVYVPQYTAVTISSPIEFGHNYTHYVELNGDTHVYSYKARCVFALSDTVNSGTRTALTLSSGGNSMSYEYSGAPVLTPAEIVQYLVDKIDNDAYFAEISAVEGDGFTIIVTSMTTASFSGAADSNCSITGDFASDVAYGIVESVLNEDSIPFLDAGVPSPGDGTYHIAALRYDDAYDNLFENASSYYTLANLDYMNSYEVEWTIKRRATDDRQYYFSYRGPIADLARLPHVLPYDGEYDVSARLLDFYGGASMCYAPSLLSIRSDRPEILAMARYADRYDYSISGLSGVRISDLGDSRVFDPNALIFDNSGYHGTTRLNLLEWSIYRESMYKYDFASDTGLQLWNDEANPPQYEPYPYSSFALKKQWGLGGDFALSVRDFEGARLRDVVFLKLGNTVFNTEFQAGFEVAGASPFDQLVFSVSEPASLRYAMPQVLTARISSATDVNISNVTVVSNYPLQGGDAVLLTKQDDPTENGLYVAASHGQYFSLQRHPMCDTAYKLAHSFFIAWDLTAISGCFLVSGPLVQQADTFADAVMSIYTVKTEQSYYTYLTDPSTYMQALADIMSADIHYVISMFDFAYLADANSIRGSARVTDPQAYQFITYVKNYDASLFSPIPQDAITGSSATFYEPYWAYSENLMRYFEAQYPNFHREDLFLHAPILDILKGNTHSLRYFVDNKYIELTDDARQVGSLPSSIDGNYFQLVNTKTFSGNMDLPRFMPVFFVANNMHGKVSYEWTLSKQITGETVARAIDAPFFAWRFNEAGRYSLSCAATMSNGDVGATPSAIEIYVF